MRGGREDGRQGGEREEGAGRRREEAEREYLEEAQWVVRAKHRWYFGSRYLPAICLRVLDTRPGTDVYLPTRSCTQPSTDLVSMPVPEWWPPRSRSRAISGSATSLPRVALQRSRHVVFLVLRHLRR